jgi:hypothetical protein
MAIGTRARVLGITVLAALMSVSHSRAVANTSIDPEVLAAREAA